ncbi:MAG: addiction module antidote protein, HigA family, partial [Veillonella sp.]|nr:addiction module antidote protein, HigA family [Veillonella sp.]
GVIIVYLPIIDNITSTCITYSKGNSIVLGIPTEDSDSFWTLLGEALQNLVERDYQRSNRKYRNNDPVTVVNY